MDIRGKKLLITAGIIILLFLGVTSYFIFFKKGTNQGQEVNVRNNLFPFNERSVLISDLPTITDSTTDFIESTVDVGTLDEIIRKDRLRKITSFPISGFVSFPLQKFITETVLDEKTNLEKQITRPVITHTLRYNDQRNGHIFESVITEESIISKKITNTNLPPAEDLTFNTSGTAGIIRYEKNGGIESFKLLLPEPPTLPPYCMITLTGDTKIGSKGDEVKKIQQYINQRFNQKLIIDGAFGKKTADFVKQLQKSFELTETGIVDESLRFKIDDECTVLKTEVARKQNEPQELQGSLISGYINQIVKNPFSDQIFTLVKENGQISGILESITGTIRTKIFNSPFTEWIPQFISGNRVLLTTYASGEIAGYVYQLNTQTGSFQKIIGPINGLTTLVSPDGSHILMSSNQNGQLVTQIITVSTRATTTLPFITLPEKCVWYSNDQFYCGVSLSIPSGTYPDDWYKGSTRFSDVLWSYSLSENRPVQIAQFPESVDIIRAQADTNFEYIFFMNKSTYELWSYRIGGSDE